MKKISVFVLLVLMLAVPLLSQTVTSVTQQGTVNGSGFVQGSVVNVNGSAVPTVFVSPTQLTFTAPVGGLGSATITVVNPIVLQSIAVTPASNALTVGKTVQLTAIGSYTPPGTPSQNLTATATWVSSNPAVAIVSGGLVTAVAAGSANITASFNGVNSPSASVSVTAPITGSFAADSTTISSGTINTVACTDPTPMVAPWDGKCVTKFVQNQTFDYPLSIPVAGSYSVSVRLQNPPSAGSMFINFSSPPCAAGSTCPETQMTIPVSAAFGTVTVSANFAAGNPGIRFRMRNAGSFVIEGYKIVSNATPPPALAITTASCPNGTVGVPYTCQLTATGGTPPYNWSISAGALPPGLTLNAATGLISGTPTSTTALAAHGRETRPGITIVNPAEACPCAQAQKHHSWLWKVFHPWSSK